jgi:hypothetical protein
MKGPLCGLCLSICVPRAWWFCRRHRSTPHRLTNSMKRYLDYLRQDRGLAENSLRVYEPLIRDFLASQMAGGSTLCPGSFDALTIRRYLLARSVDRSAEYSRLLATALAIVLPLPFPSWRYAC